MLSFSIDNPPGCHSPPPVVSRPGAVLCVGHGTSKCMYAFPLVRLGPRPEGEVQGKGKGEGEGQGQVQEEGEGERQEG